MGGTGGGPTKHGLLGGQQWCSRVSLGMPQESASAKCESPINSCTGDTAQGFALDTAKDTGLPRNIYLYFRPRNRIYIIENKDFMYLYLSIGVCAYKENLYLVQYPELRVHPFCMVVTNRGGEPILGPSETSARLLEISSPRNYGAHISMPAKFLRVTCTFPTCFMEIRFRRTKQQSAQRLQEEGPFFVIHSPSN